MKLEYLKGADNKIADTLSRLPPKKLDEHAVAELLDYAHNSYKPRAETANMNIIVEGEHMGSRGNSPVQPDCKAAQELLQLS